MYRLGFWEIDFEMETCIQHVDQGEYTWDQYLWREGKEAGLNRERKWAMI